MAFPHNLKPYKDDTFLDENDCLYRQSKSGRWVKVGTSRGKKWRHLQGTAANKLSQIRNYDILSAVIQEACRQSGLSNAQVKHKTLNQIKNHASFENAFERARNNLGLNPKASVEDKLRSAEVAFHSQRIYANLNLENPSKIIPSVNTQLTYPRLIQLVSQTIKIAETDHKSLENGMTIANKTIVKWNETEGLMLFVDKEYRSRGSWGTVSAMTMLASKSGIIRCAIKEAATDEDLKQKAAVNLEIENKNLAEIFSKDPKAPVAGPVLTSIFTPELSAIVTPLKDSSLYRIIKMLPLDRCVILSKQVLCLASWMRSQNIFHGDLKPSNLVVDGNDLLLIDFATKRDMQNKEDVAGEIVSGTPPYKSYIDYLQLSQTTDHDARVKIFERIDDFAWAVTLFTIFSRGRAPYDTYKPDPTSKLGNLSYCTPSHTYKGEILKDMNPEGQKLFAALLVQEPEKRMSLAQATEIILANDNIFSMSMLEEPTQNIND